MLILGLAPIAFASVILSSVVSIIELSKNLWNGVKKIDRMLQARPDTDNHYQCSDDIQECNIMKELHYLSMKNYQFLGELEKVKEEIIDRLTETIPEFVELNRRLSKIFVNSNAIHSSYEKFLMYFLNTNVSDGDRELVIRSCYQIIDSDNSCGVLFLLGESHSLLVGNRELGLPNTINLLAKHYKVYLQYTNIAQSPQQFLYNLLGSVIFTELQGLFALKYSFELLHRYRHDNYTKHIELVENNFHVRVNRTVTAFKQVMVDLSREVRKSDPPEHKESVTFIELTQTFQKYIINKYDLEPENYCWKDCNSYKDVSTLSITCKSKNKQLCNRQNACQGTLYDCEYPIEGAFNVCFSNKNDTRRYEYIVTENGQTYGTKNKRCEKPEVKCDFEWAGIYHCQPCICTCCNHSPKSIDIISTTPALITSYDDNYVVTGARFINKNNKIYIQIQQAKQLPNGHINDPVKNYVRFLPGETSVEWVPINTLSEEEPTLNWKYNREVMLDDHHAPKDHVLIGLGLYLEDGRLKLMTYTSSLNFTSGQLFGLRSSRDFSSARRRNLFDDTNDEISVHDLNVPALKGVEHNVISKHNQFIKFETSNFLNDLGQSTIPFIDIQEVTTNPPTAMSGVGLYHKTIKGSGGFLGLRLFTFDVEPYVQPDLPPEKSKRNP